jgi:hypothetical protein
MSDASPLNNGDGCRVCIYLITEMDREQAAGAAGWQPGV